MTRNIPRHADLATAQIYRGLSIQYLQAIDKTTYPRCVTRKGGPGYLKVMRVTKREIEGESDCDCRLMLQLDLVPIER